MNYTQIIRLSLTNNPNLTNEIREKFYYYFVVEIKTWG